MDKQTNKTMNTAFSKPTEKAIKNAKRVYSSPFVKEVYMNGFMPKNDVDHFGISVVVVRSGLQMINDMTFTKKTGKLISSECIEKRYID